MKKEIFIEGDHIENLFTDDLNPFLKWGITWIFVIAVLLFSLTWFVRWPETIEIGAILTSEESPGIVISDLSGRLEKLYISNGASVKKGELLATIENPAKREDIRQLEQFINTVDSLLLAYPENLSKLPVSVPHLSELGELQHPFEQFQRVFAELKHSLSAGHLAGKRRLLEDRASSVERLENYLRLKQETAEKDYQLAVTVYERKLSLKKNNELSEAELDFYLKDMLAKELVLQNNNQAILQNEQRKFDVEADRIELDEEIYNKTGAFQMAFENLKSAYDKWKKKYQFVSPVAGIVSLPVHITKGALVKPDEPVFFVFPEKSTPIVRMILPQNNFTAIDTANIVRIKLSAYPVEQYGVLEGKIEYISTIPINGKFNARVALSNGLITSHGKQITFTNGMEGQAEIVLHNERLLIQIFEKLKSFD